MSAGPRRIVLATGNPGKVREIQQILGPGWQVLPQSEFGIAGIEESGSTFEENALAKARHAARVAQLPALADDSGLAVDALGGAPGVRSARYAGEGATDAGNVARLLDDMAAVPDDRRGGRFHCALALVRSAEDPRPILVSATWEGRIVRQPRGAGGFGYDPVFEDPSGLTAAELPEAEKNDRSHRGQALRALVSLLPEAL